MIGSKWFSVIPLATAAALVTACDLSTDLPAPILEWTGEFIAAPGWQIQGGAGMLWVENSRFVTVGLNISEDQPGAQRAWRVRGGMCLDGGPVLGSNDAYEPLIISPTGAAEALADILATPDPNAAYHVAIHLSVDEMETVIACADLFLENPL
jgi:hypothetical protein